MVIFWQTPPFTLQSDVMNGWAQSCWVERCDRQCLVTQSMLPCFYGMETNYNLKRIFTFRLRHIHMWWHYAMINSVLYLLLGIKKKSSYIDHRVKIHMVLMIFFWIQNFSFRSLLEKMWEFLCLKRKKIRPQKSSTNFILIEFVYHFSSSYLCNYIYP